MFYIGKIILILILFSLLYFSIWWKAATTRFFLPKEISLRRATPSSSTSCWTLSGEVERWHRVGPVCVMFILPYSIILGFNLGLGLDLCLWRRPIKMQSARCCAAAIPGVSFRLVGLTPPWLNLWNALWALLELRAGVDRDEIAGCIEKAYEQIHFNEATRILFFSTSKKMTDYAKKVSYGVAACSRFVLLPSAGFRWECAFSPRRSWCWAFRSVWPGPRIVKRDHITAPSQTALSATVQVPDLGGLRVWLGAVIRLSRSSCWAIRAPGFLSWLVCCRSGGGVYLPVTPSSFHREAGPKVPAATTPLVPSSSGRRKCPSLPQSWPSKSSNTLGSWRWLCSPHAHRQTHTHTHAYTHTHTHTHILAHRNSYGQRWTFERKLDDRRVDSHAERPQTHFCRRKRCVLPSVKSTSVSALEPFSTILCFVHVVKKKSPL